MRTRITALLLALLLAAGGTCAYAEGSGDEDGAYSFEAGVENLAEHGISLDELIEEFKVPYGNGFTGYWLLPYSPENDPTFYLFDVTGDGCVDVCTHQMWGSGMVRTHTIVFDPLSHERYILDGYNYDYVVRGVEDGRLVVMKRGPNGYGDPITETFGTVVLEDGQLVFVPDEPEP